MLALLIAAGIALTGYSFGLAILRTLRTVPSGHLERSVLAILIGSGILTFVVLGIGLAGWLSQSAAWIIVTLGLLVAAYLLRGLSPGALAVSLKKTAAGFRRQQRLVWGCWLFLLLSVALNLLAALAPISGTDALAYHLAIPKLWVED